MPEEQQPESNLSPAQKRPRRRGHRGGRGRGRGRISRDAVKKPVESAEITDIPPAPEQAPEPVHETREVPAPHPPRKFSASAIAQAVDEVRQIVESLEQALEQMEEVLKLVQTAEQQKIGDEREIESLRRALRKIQPPRHHRSESSEESSS